MEAEHLASSTTSSTGEVILVHVRQLNQTQREQLFKKFQPGHFIVTRNLSFNVYREISTFEKEFHKVDVGNGFLTNKSGREMTIYLSNSFFQDNVVDPLNNQCRLYFSLLYDGSLSSKVNDEKELYIIKTCQNESPKFNMLSLQELEEPNKPS